MKPKSAKSLELYDIMMKRGYPEEFCDQISKNLNTDWTAQRMIGYLSHYKNCRWKKSWMRCLQFLATAIVLCKSMSWKKAMPDGMNI